MSEAHCHHLIAETAKSMARAVYVELARKHNDWYSTHPDEEAYVEASWHLYVEDSRRVLAQMLGQSVVPERQKELICDALIQDKSLIRGRGSRLQARGLN